MNSTNTPTPKDDVIDSRAVIAALDDPDLDPAERAALAALADQGDTVENWPHGATLVRDSYFVAYAMEFANDIGAITAEIGWPYTCIDWDSAATDLRTDYTPLDFNGVTYWAR